MLLRHLPEQSGLGLALLPQQGGLLNSGCLFHGGECWVAIKGEGGGELVVTWKEACVIKLKTQAT